MNWNDNEGPWGSNGGDKKKQDTPPPPGSPWGRQPRSTPPGGSVPPDMDIDEALKRIKKMMGPLKPRGHAHALALGIAVLVGLWLLSGVYMVGTDQIGVVMRFGAMHRTELPGLQYHLPTPFEEVLLPVVTSQNEIQIGFRKSGGRGSSRTIPEESLMLTQDENIVDVQFTVFWRITEVTDYLFQIRNPDETIKMAAESVMREVIGQNKLQFALTEGRAQIAEDARTRLQAMMDEYKAGITISQINLQGVAAPEEVKDAFQDVVNARLDMERFQNQAAAHVNKVIPEAKGRAAGLVQQAMAYRDQKIALAKGEAARFNDVLIAYAKSKDVTAQRLYLETMEDVLAKANKVVTGAPSSGVVPFYPLNDLTRKNKE